MREIGMVGPGMKGRPVVNGIGDDARLVGGDEASEEFKWGWRGF